MASKVVAIYTRSAARAARPSLRLGSKHPAADAEPGPLARALAELRALRDEMPEVARAYGSAGLFVLAAGCGLSDEAVALAERLADDPIGAIIELQAAPAPAPHEAEPLRPIGALDLWRDQLRRGERRAGDIDPLSAAACWEAAALESERAGMHRRARRELAHAAECLNPGRLP